MEPLERKPPDSTTLPQRVAQTVRTLEPGAEIILYGSRSRGDASSRSDWDFLILLEGPVDEDRKDAIRHRLYEIEWTTGQAISAMIYSRTEWNRPRSRVMPFHLNVEREGRTL